MPGGDAYLKGLPSVLHLTKEGISLSARTRSCPALDEGMMLVGTNYVVVGPREASPSPTSSNFSRLANSKMRGSR